MKNSEKPWSQEEVGKLVSMKDNGFTYSHISTVMGRSENALKKKMGSLKKQAKKVKVANDPAIDYNRAWSEADMQKLYELRKEYVPYQIIAQHLNRSLDSCKSKYSSTVWQDLDYIVENTNNNNNAEIRKAVKDQKRQQMVERYDKRIQNIKIGAEIVADHLASCIEALPPIPDPDPSWKVRSKPGSNHEDEDAVIILSDIHIGADYPLAETGGISEYNEEVMKRRMRNLQKSVRDIVELHSQLYNIPRLHIACLGDVVAGMNDVGEWSFNEIKMDIMNQYTNGYSILAECIRYWLEIFDEIVFYGVRGNHGRLAKKGSEKDKANFDNLAYIYLQLMFVNNPRVKFVIPSTWYICQEIKNHQVLMVHGDDVKGGSFPIKKISDFQKEMSGMLNKKIDITLAGHFHNACEMSNNHGRALINGSVMGSDIYSLKDIHKISRPEQIFFGMHEKRGMTWKYNIDLEK